MSLPFVVITFVGFVGLITWVCEAIRQSETPKFDDLWPVERLPEKESEKEFARLLDVDHKNKRFSVTSTPHFRVSQWEEDDQAIRSAVVLPHLKIDKVDALHVRHWNVDRTAGCKTKEGAWTKCVMDGVPMVAVFMRDKESFPEAHVKIYARNGWSAEELLERISKKLFGAKEEV
jgi:hypothetical protein